MKLLLILLLPSFIYASSPKQPSLKYTATQLRAMNPKMKKIKDDKIEQERFVVPHNKLKRSLKLRVPFNTPETKPTPESLNLPEFNLVFERFK